MIDLAGLVGRVRALERPERPRVIVGITGPPGSGKSTLADRLVAALGPGAVLVGMDGFHLSNEELRRLGRDQRKGALDTFDGWGYAALLRRIATETDHTVYAPTYDRSIEEAVAIAVPVPPEARLVVTEGNYLLVDSPPWDEVKTMLDETWFCDVDAAVRTDRLVARHQRFGKSEADAKRWVFDSDEVNAQVVLATRRRADLVVETYD